MDRKQHTTGFVGKFELAVVPAQPPADGDHQATDRAKVLAAWLLVRWEQDQKEAA